MNLNIEWQQNSLIIKIQKSAIPVANPHMLCQILFQNWHIFHQFTKSFAHIFYFYFEFFFATFSFLLTWQNILRNLKNGIESTFLPYYYHSSTIVLVIWHILKFWKNLEMILKILKSSNVNLYPQQCLLLKMKKIKQKNP